MHCLQFVTILMLLSVMCSIANSKSISRHRAKRNSGPHDQFHRRRRQLEEMYNRLQIIERLTNPTTHQESVKFLALRIEWSNVEPSVQVAQASQNQQQEQQQQHRRMAATRTDMHAVASATREAKRRHAGDDEGYKMTYIVPVSDGLQMRIETEQTASQSSATSSRRVHQYNVRTLEKKVNDLCRVINGRVTTGFRMSCIH